MIRLKNNITYLILGFLLAISSLPALAGHISGGEMFYEFYGRNGDSYSYRVTLRLLIRCNSPRGFPAEIFIGVFDRKDNQRIRDVRTSLTLRNQINRPNSDPCISNPPELCFEVAEYTTDILLAGRENGYLLSAQIILRVAGIANVEGSSGSMGATYTAEIPGLSDGPDAMNNYSARFNADDLVLMCSENFFNYNFSASDGNRDSLRYRFCEAYQTANFFSDLNNPAPPDSPPYPIIPYALNFAGSSPFGSRASINSASGLASGIAPISGIYLISVCVDEYRAGKLIATQRKDIQVAITPCSKAAAILEEEYNLCSDSHTVFMVNLSNSALIQSYEWNLFNENGQLLVKSSEPRFSHAFSDTGIYKVILYTNKGIQCPDSTQSTIRYYPGFIADFSFSGLCFGGVTRFKDETKFLYGSISGYSWLLNIPASPDNLSQIADPVFRYETKGEKSVFLKVENSNGCKDSISRTVVIADNPPVMLGFRDTLICKGDSLQLKAEGGGRFLWSEGPGFNSTRIESSPWVSPTLTTTYRVIQTEENCRGEDSVKVRVVNDVSLKINGDTTICRGDQLILLATGNGLEFLWFPKERIENETNSRTIAMPLTATTTFGVKARIGSCEATDSFRVNTVPYPSANAGEDKTICIGDSVGIGENNDATRIAWRADGQALTFVTPKPIVSPMVKTTYTLFVYDTLGCIKPGIDSVSVFVLPRVNLTVTPDTSIVVNQSLQLQASGAEEYRWMPAANLNNAFIANPLARYSSPTHSLRYTLIGYNRGGCSDTATISIKVFANGPGIYMPNAFTPNGDGLNETLKPTLAGIRSLDFFRIYNRYGEVVFQTSNSRNAWDGRYKGQLQASGGFVWIVQAIDVEGNVLQQKGSVMLIR